jgi:tetratricopeptide (TPR) repeat protein
VKLPFNSLAYCSSLMFGVLMSMPVHSQVASSSAPMFSSVGSAAKLGSTETADVISSLGVKQNASGQWVVTYEISLGGKTRSRLLVVEASVDPKEPSLDPRVAAMVPLYETSGPQSHTLELNRPDVFTDFYNAQLNVVERTHKPAQTEWVVAKLMGHMEDGSPFEVRKMVRHTIRWPDKKVWDADQSIRRDGPSASLANAVQLIDVGNREALESARMLLERLLLKDEKLVGAYIELARVSMKTNWGPEGLLQARRYLDSALSIDASNVNALILRGYVSAHQGHHKDAETDFVNASKSNPPNLWLWSNWGELLAMQGKADDAIKMYLKAATHPPTLDTYDRARADAFENLIDLYGKKRDLDALEKMHEMRVRDFGGVGCYLVEYALFEIQERNAPDVAIDLLKDASPSSCEGRGSKETLGVAYYLKWSRASDARRMEYMNRARVYFPVGARLFYTLGSSAATSKVASALAKSGENVDQKDNHGMTALAYAVERRDHETASRLVKVGASPTATVGDQGVPVALVPVFNNDLQGIRLMRRLGVDYSNINFQGMTALSHARKLGDKKLLEALGQLSPDI